MYVYTVMPLKRIFVSSRSRRENFRDSPSDIHAYDSHPPVDDFNEQDDTIESLSNANAGEHRYQTRRQSSVQILDIKFLQNLSNQADNVSTDSRNGPEGVCECE